MNTDGPSIREIQRSHIPEFFEESKSVAESDLRELKWRVDKALDILQKVPDGAVISMYQYSGGMSLLLHESKEATK